MQLHIRGNSNYVLEAASLAELRAQVAQQEGSEDVLLYVGGKPLDYEMSVESLGECHIDVTVPLKGGKVRKIKRFRVLKVVKFAGMNAEFGPKID